MSKEFKNNVGIYDLDFFKTAIELECLFDRTITGITNMDWGHEVKVHENWKVIQAFDNGKYTGKFIIFHLKCKNGVVPPQKNNLYGGKCIECDTEVPESVSKRLVLVLNKDRMIS
jgi:hypothetical protein